jgi:hypothetical protein
MLVMPRPRPSISSASKGDSSRSVNPAWWIAFQNRFPGRAK